MHYFQSVHQFLNEIEEEGNFSCLFFMTIFLLFFTINSSNKFNINNRFNTKRHYSNIIMPMEIERKKITNPILWAALRNQRSSTRSTAKKIKLNEIKQTHLMFLFCHLHLSFFLVLFWHFNMAAVKSERTRTQT